MKSLDQKIAAIHADPHGCREFILADAKDADMAFGIGAPGKSPERHDAEVRFRTLAEYREQMRLIARQGLVDILLMSASTAEVLVMQERIFDGSHITPAVRANDATDVHAMRGSRIPEQPARPFRTATIDHAQCGHLDCDPDERSQGVDLGLYSVTFNNDVDLDRETLLAYNEFREEAERKGFRHFLEVFNPNQPGVIRNGRIGEFLVDAVARTLAGVTSAGRPLFLKLAYPGPGPLEELVAYDPHLVVGILGGSAGTTRDAFQLLHDARKYGAKVALFGRKINQAENQLAFIEFLRLIADGLLDPAEGVRAYHGVLQKLGIAPHRTLEDDLTVTTQGMSYAAPPSPSPVSSVPAVSNSTPQSVRQVSASTSEPAPRFADMSAAERLAYHRDR
ncbi:MAG: hypothetical protein R3C01_16005, partial [Planctomycetaceae bacterium]